MGERAQDDGDGSGSMADAPPTILSQLLESVLDRAGTGVCLFDADLRFVLVNEVAARLDGRAAADHVGRALRDVAPALADEVAPLLEAVIRSGEPHLGAEFQIELAAWPGAPRWFRANILAIDGPERAAAMVAMVFGDVTEQVAGAARLAGLAELSRLLNRASTTEEVIEVLQSGRGAIDGPVFNIGLLDAERRSLRVHMPPPYDDAFLGDLHRLPLDDPHGNAFLDAFKLRVPVFLRSAAERAERYPHVVSVTSQVGLTASVSLPLLDADGQPFGVLGLAWPEGAEPQESDRARFALLADVCSHAFQRTLRTDAGSELIHHLQGELLARLDDADGVEVAVGYRPSVGALGFGGDWYDVVAARPDVTALIVGDVVGHGIVAAGQMAQAKGVVRALVMNAPSLAHVFPQATRSLQHLQMEYVGTVAIAEIDRAAGRLTWATAGHPPPILLPLDGQAEVLWAPQQPPVGMATDVIDLPSRALEAESLLVLYTDGLVEQPGVAIHDRIAALARVLDGLPRDLEVAEARDRVIAEMVGDAATDDIAIVVARIA